MNNIPEELKALRQWVCYRIEERNGAPTKIPYRTDKVGRGNAGGFVDPTRDPLSIAGSNLTATKARLLLMACLMKFGCLPPAADPTNPTTEETETTKAKLAEYQEGFDTH